MNYLNSKQTSKVWSWINNLKGYLSEYIKLVESELKLKKNEKFCFDLNYIIDVILDRFLKARRLDGNVKFYHNTQVNSKEVLNGNNALNCKRDIYNDITNFKKLRRMFYNFCEDSSYIKDNFSLIKSLGKCEAYLPDIQNRKRILTKLLRRRGHSSPELFNYSKECNLNNLGNFLNTMNCNPENSEKEEGSQHEKGMQLNDQVSRPDPETATVSEQGEVDGDLPADTKELMDLEKNQDEEEFNLNTTYSAASLLGTSVVLYFLSRVKHLLCTQLYICYRNFCTKFLQNIAFI
ncbi:hypothetical protein PVMG_04516 [Plasmodium vivax Mauritania I]|uniref:Uncharacterized protein n=1 Tax=Plasmodium vivax Mauritania I TaxID=1035515 RepID=A0A0J9T3V0_PLAVI|nr:hypothetical protein PVMG_04516 [Plasmodium vivax Mauritania I]